MKFTQASKTWLLRKVSYNKWEIAQEFVWYLDYEDKRVYVIIPQWFITDFWNIPRILQSFLNPTKFLAYVLHDWLYSEGIYIMFQDDFETHSIVPTRLQADKILRDALAVEKAWFIERNIIYYWVRIWWFFNYKR